MLPVGEEVLCVTDGALDSCIVRSFLNVQTTTLARNFLSISHPGGSVLVSDDHYLFRANEAAPSCSGVVDEENDGSFVRAGELEVGDMLVLVDQTSNCTQTVEVTAIGLEPVTDW